MPVKLASAGRDVIPTACAGRSNGAGSLGADVSSREGNATLPGPRTVAEAAALLATIPPFSELSPVERARLAPALEEVTYAEGGVIFPQGTTADALYILREGQAWRFVDGVLLDTVRPHSVFGGVELLCNGTRSSTLVAAPGCVVWKLPADRFHRLLRETPAVAARFTATVSSQLADARRDVAALVAEDNALTALLPAEARVQRVGRAASGRLDAAEVARPTARVIQDVFAPARAA